MAPDAVIATNTSSLSVTEIAAGCARPERVGGLHFFNPPPVMKLVEAIAGLRSDPAMAEALVAFIEAHRQGADRRHRYAGLCRQSCRPRLWAGSVAHCRAGHCQSRAKSIVLMKEAAGFRMGPFELLDLVGGDVTHAVMESIYAPLLRRADVSAVGADGGAGRRRFARPQEQAGLLRLFRTRRQASAPTIAVTAQAKARIGLDRRRRRRQRSGGAAE